MAFLRQPNISLQALSLILPSRPERLLKNLSVVPKAFWLAERIKEENIAHIHAHWASTSATLAMLASHISGVPWSLTAHRWDIAENNLLHRKSERARFIRFISRSGLDMAIKRGMPGKANATIIHMGIPLSREKTAVHENRGRTIIICPANLVPVKGHAYLLQAVSHIEGNVELWLAGNGELREALEQEVVELGLEESVKFLGQLPHEQLIGLYRQGEVDLVVLPSLDLGNGLHEGIPVSLMEAMAHAIPVISTSTGGIPELLEGGAGLMVPPADVAALAQAIQALTEDADWRRALGEAGQRRIEESFALEAVVSQLEGKFRKNGGLT